MSDSFKTEVTRKFLLPVVDEFLERAAALRAAGVHRLRYGELEVEFSPEPAPPMAHGVLGGPDVPKGLGEPEKCRCGHEETEHAGEGFCLRGCPVENCVDKKPPEATP